MGEPEEQVQEMEEAKMQLESKKNREITELKERIAELMFKKTLLPVTEQLTQTPYSKKQLESQISELESQNDLSQPQVSQHVAGSGQQMIAMELQSGLTSLMNLVGQLSSNYGSRKQVDSKQGGDATYTEEEVNLIRQKLTFAQKEAEDAKKRENDVAMQWNLTATKYAKEEEARKKLEGELEEEQRKVAVVQRKSFEMEKATGDKVSEIGEVRRELESLRREFVQQQQKLSENSESHSHAITELQIKHEEHLIQREQALKNENKTLIADMTAKSTEITEVTKKFISLQEDYFVEKESHKVTKEKLSKAEQSFEELDSSRKNFNDELLEKKQELTASKKEVASLKRERTQANVQIKKLEKKTELYEKKIATLTEKQGTAREENKEIQQQLEEKDEEKQSLQNEITRLESQIKLLKKEVDDMRLNSEVKTMSKEIKKIKRSSKDKNDEVIEVEDDCGKKRKVHPHIILSGFREKRQITKGITELQGTLLKTGNDGGWDERCTHMVIASHDVRTMKTIAAALTHKWVMPKIWVTDSVKAGKWLDEKDYGYILKHEGVMEKSIHMTDAFCLVGGSDRIRTGTQLIELGKGKLTDNIDNANIVLRAPVDGNHEGDHMAFTWEGFISWIFPTTWKPPISMSQVAD